MQFGSFSIGRGKAFAIENDAITQAHASVEESVPVGKELATIERKVWLIESVEYSALKPFLDTLPRMASVTPSRSGRLASAADRNSAARAKSQAAVAINKDSGERQFAATQADSRRQLVASFGKSVGDQRRTPVRRYGQKIQMAQASKQPRYAKAVNIVAK